MAAHQAREHRRQPLNAVAGVIYLWDEATIFKLEFRHDGANQPVFSGQKGLVPTGF